MDVRLPFYRILLFIVLLTGALPWQVEAEVTGLEIAREMKARETGFGNYTADMKMVLISISGKQTIRKLRVFSREVKGDGDQSLAIFESPADVKGTGFLTHTHIQRDDDQWLYLPSLKRVKRISPSNKTAPFMGSEFSYEDLVSYEVENYTYKYIGEEKFNSINCYVIERFPVSEFSGYRRQRVWVDAKRYVALKIDYYDKQNEKVKTLISRQFKKYLDKFWYAHEMEMQNHQSGKASILYWQNFKFQQPLRDSDFNPNSMKRIH